MTPPIWIPEPLLLIPQLEDRTSTFRVFQRKRHGNARGLAEIRNAKLAARLMRDLKLREQRQSDNFVSRWLNFFCESVLCLGPEFTAITKLGQ